MQSYPIVLVVEVMPVILPQLGYADQETVAREVALRSHLASQVKEVILTSFDEVRDGILVAFGEGYSVTMTPGGHELLPDGVVVRLSQPTAGLVATSTLDKVQDGVLGSFEVPSYISLAGHAKVLLGTSYNTCSGKRNLQAIGNSRVVRSETHAYKHIISIIPSLLSQTISHLS